MPILSPAHPGRLLLPLVLLLTAVPAQAQWSDDPAQNLIIADRPGGQVQPKLVATPDGGFYVSWFGDPGFDVFLQRLDAGGVVQWEENGLRIADRDYTSTEDYGLALDSEGNALLAFRFEGENGITQVVANRVTPAGDLLWPAPGVFVSDDPAAAASPRIAGLPGGASVVAWTSYDTGQIVLQKLDASGAPQWGPDGVTVALPSGLFLIGDLHADAEGNVIIAGQAQISTFDRRLWAQKLAPDGAPLWGSQPVEVFDGDDGVLQFGYQPPFVPDGEGGAVFAWYQIGGVNGLTVRAQHVRADGSLAFPQNGVDVAPAAGREQTAPAAAYDAATGDIYVVWPEEHQIGTTRTFGLTAQRIDASGARQWGEAGREIVPQGDQQASQAVALPAPDGALFAWTLGSFPEDMRIDAARLDATGAFVWPEETVALKEPAGANSRMEGSLSAQGYAAYVWSDGPSDTASEAIKAQNISFDGQLGPVEASDPVASVEPEALALTVTAGNTASATLTLSNLAAAGGPALTFTAAATRPDTVLVDFEDGQIPYDLTLGNPGQFVDTDGGNPGRWLRNNQLSTFAPSLYLPATPDSPFAGDLVARRVTSIRVDAQTLVAPFGVAERPFSLKLTRFNGQPDNPEAHDYVYLPGPEVPQPGEGWQSYVFEIPWGFEGVMPEGWAGGYYEDPENLPPGVRWQDVASEADLVELMWGHPAFFYLLQDFDLGVDNLAVTFEAETEAVSVTPAEGDVAAGASQVLTVTVDAGELAVGEYAFHVILQTNDPARPTLSVPIAVTVNPIVATEDGALPTVFALSQNYPNPFASQTQIAYALPEASHVKLSVYDAVGRLVTTLLDGERPAGYHEVVWEAGGLASGVYFYRIEAGAFQSTHKMILLK